VAIVATTVSCFAMTAEPLAAAPAVSRAVTSPSVSTTDPVATADADRAESTLRVAAGELPADAVPVAPLPPMPAQVEHRAPAPVPPAATPQSGGSSSALTGYGCAAAIAYLQAYAEPSFTIECPAYAAGGQAMTCDHHPPQCPNSRVIAIRVPCPAAYMNEAHNSWVLLGEASGIDPYGWCH
jgi:hypothetical protein